jgi:hypothetical protein
MNRYEEKQEARRQRYIERSADASKESDARYNQAKKMQSAIPFGQPILIGHYSETRDRNYRAKIGNNYRKAFEASDKAKYYANRADAVGTGGISSDDPDAIQKLRSELESAERSQVSMKAANKAIRDSKRNGSDAVAALMAAAGLTEPQAIEILKPDFMGRIGFPQYSLSNNNANIRRIKQRIEDLQRMQQAAAAGPVEKELDGGIKYLEDDNRVQLIFPGKPSEEIRNILKSRAFKWSPSRGAWVRFLNPAGKYAAQDAIEKIKKLQEVV